MKRTLLFFLLFSLSFATLRAQVVISEIMYSAPVGGGPGGGASVDSLQFIELFNSGTVDVNLKDYHFATAITDTLPDITLKAGEYFVNAVNADYFKAKFGIDANHQWQKGTLAGTNQQAKRIDLFDGTGTLVDSVRYRINAPWPVILQGGGGGAQQQQRISIVLCDPSADNAIGANWFASTIVSSAFVNNKAVKASPGKADCPFIEVTANTKTLSTYKGVNLQIPLNSFATPVDAVISITKQPTSGKLTRQGQNYVYAPNAGFCGVDEFDFHAAVGQNFDNGKVTINVLCDIPYKKYSIGAVTKDEDANNSPDSLGTFVELSGVVYSPNYATSPSTQFCLVDETVKEDGIFVVRNQANGGYALPAIGDKVTVKGRIAQNQGLTVLTLDTVIVANTKATLFAPTPVTALDETTEAQLVELKGLTLITPTQWGTATGGGGGAGGNTAVGYQLDVTDGTNKYVIFVDKDIEDLFFNAGPKNAKFDCVGIGSQVAQAGGPGGGGLTSGYRLLPRQLSDLKIYTATNDVVLGQNTKIFPNPFQNEVNISFAEKMEAFMVTNVSGQNILTINHPTENQVINTTSWSSGVYFMTVKKDGKQFTSKLIK